MPLAARVYIIYSSVACHCLFATGVCDAGRDKRSDQEPRQQAAAEQEKSVSPSSREERPRTPTFPPKKRLWGWASMILSLIHI